MDMDNNDILIRLRYALDIKDTDMVKIFKLGGFDVTREEVRKILIKTKDSKEEDVEPDDINQDNIPCKDRKSTRLNSSHVAISYAVFCLKKKKKKIAAIRGTHYKQK